MSFLTPIETRFDGHRFRSRTEARWAVFFRELGLIYQYESEGYVLPSGEWYLPDFWLPEIDAWFECKGIPDSRGLNKAYELCVASQKIVMVGLGTPSLKKDDRDQILLYFWDANYRDALLYGDNLHSNELLVGFCSPADGTLGVINSALPGAATYWAVISSSEIVEAAYEKAAYARFEHGETP
jgi:hypothetical protein